MVTSILRRPCWPSFRQAARPGTWAAMRWSPQPPTTPPWWSTWHRFSEATRPSSKARRHPCRHRLHALALALGQQAERVDGERRAASMITKTARHSPDVPIQPRHLRRTRLVGHALRFADSPQLGQLPRSGVKGPGRAFFSPNRPTFARNRTTTPSDMSAHRRIWASARIVFVTAAVGLKTASLGRVKAAVSLQRASFG